MTLSLLHLAYVCEVDTNLDLSRYRAGLSLRGGLGNVMRRANCTQWVKASGQPSDSHIATCPVCWLLAANENPGNERRGYSIIAPNISQILKPGESFSFVLSLFGNAQRFFPYFMISLPVVGRQGIGPGRGRFSIKEVHAFNPLKGMSECIAPADELLVKSPSLYFHQQDVVAYVQQILENLRKSGGRLKLHFHRPTRLISMGRLVKVPDFSVLFSRLLHRYDRLCKLYAGMLSRPEADRLHLQQLADQVRMVDVTVEWIDVFSHSSRTNHRAPMGGFIGTATYQAPLDVWVELLTALIWGQSIQVGKDVVKGSGWYTIDNPDRDIIAAFHFPH